MFTYLADDFSLYPANSFTGCTMNEGIVNQIISNFTGLSTGLTTGCVFFPRYYYVEDLQHFPAPLSYKFYDLNQGQKNIVYDVSTGSSWTGFLFQNKNYLYDDFFGYSVGSGTSFSQNYTVTGYLFLQGLSTARII
jgi:hypothetical protein